MKMLLWVTRRPYYQYLHGVRLGSLQRMNLEGCPSGACSVGISRYPLIHGGLPRYSYKSARLPQENGQMQIGREYSTNHTGPSTSSEVSIVT